MSLKNTLNNTRAAIDDATATAATIPAPLSAVENAAGHVAAVKLSISTGNRKMHAVPSVSLPPIVTCNPEMCKHCGGKCYALRHIYKLYPACRAAYDGNLSLYQNDPDSYFSQLSTAFAVNRYFRMHVSGDCPTADYFTRLCKAARKNPGCTVLMFTKQYSFVNDYLAAGHKIPKNLIVIMSGWGDIKPINPYNLPETNVIFKGAETFPESWKVCPGNCENCAARGLGCWTAKKGDVIAFHEH